MAWPRWAARGGSYPGRVMWAVLGTALGGCVVTTAGQQEGGHCLGEAVWVLPEEQMAQLREGHELCTRDAVCEQLSVTRVDHGVCVPVQDQGACQDARLPPSAGVPCACGCLRRQHPWVRWPGSPEFDEAAYEFWPVLDGACRQSILHVAAQRHLGSHAGGRRDQPHGGPWHGIGQRPAWRRACKNQTVNLSRPGFVGGYEALASGMTIAWP